MNHQDLPISFKVKAVEHWQKDESVHPLTCGNDSSHRPLHPFYKLSTKEFYLMCFNCQYKQHNVPDVVYQKFLSDKKIVSKPKYFQFHLFQPNLANTVDGVESFDQFNVHYLNERFFPITGDQEPYYYQLKDKFGVSLGILFSGDYIVYNENEVIIQDPEKFNETFTKHF